MRNRLIELLRKADDATEVNDCDYPTYEKAMQAFYTNIADHLLANGVIVPPCAAGDTAYFITVNAEGEYIIGSGKFSYSWLDYPRVIYATKEEAERKLAELEGVSDGTM